MALPTEKTMAVKTPNLTTMLLYGPPKIGKSTIANSFPKALFVAAEEGLKFLDAYKQGVRTWEEVLGIQKDLLKPGHDFQTVVFDTADALFTLCTDYVCKKLNIDHPSDEDWGKGWAALRDNFQKLVTPLAAPDLNGKTRFGLIFLSHDRDVEVKGRVTKTKRTTCTLPGTARRVLLPMVDVVGYCGFARDKNGEPTDERIVTFKPTEVIEAGDRTGRLPDYLPMCEEDWYDTWLMPSFQAGRVKRKDDDLPGPATGMVPKKKT